MDNTLTMKSISPYLPKCTALVIGLAVLSAGFSGNSLATGFKCWTNKEGVRECGTSVPPEYAQQGHDIISDQGYKIGEGERAKTQAELLEEERQKKLAEEEARRKAEQDRQEAMQRNRDRVLLSTFSSEKEIVASRDEKISAIESNIKLTETRVEKLKDNLKKLRTNAAHEERGGKPVSKKLSKSIAAVERQVVKNEKYIADRRAEQQNIRDEHQGMIERFRKLKSEEKK